VIVGLVTAFFLRAGHQTLTRVALACSAWILIGILPVFNVFFVSHDLQSSRYLYLSSVGWSVLLAALIAECSTNTVRFRWFAPVVMSVLVIASAFGVRMHVRPWVEAGNLRDRVGEQAIRHPEMQRCDSITLAGLPDTVRGAYVFRVGAAEEFKRILDVNTSVGDQPGPCSFRWEEQTSTFSAMTR
jgi:hypothetical protein